MKRLLLSLLVLGAAAAGRAAPDAAGTFGMISADYKKPQELPESFFNPFKSQASALGPARKDGASATNEAVADAIGHRRISGIVYAPDARADEVVVGDQVFSLGDELEFPDGERSALTPLVPGASVVLREVAPDHLQFEITPDGEPARRLTFPLRTFWRP